MLPLSSPGPVSCKPWLLHTALAHRPGLTPATPMPKIWSLLRFHPSQDTPSWLLSYWRTHAQAEAQLSPAFYFPKPLPTWEMGKLPCSGDWLSNLWFLGKLNSRQMCFSKQEQALGASHRSSLQERGPVAQDHISD